MKSIKNTIIYGGFTWLIPFLTSILFFSKNGKPLMDIFFIESIMILVGSISGTIFLILYFKDLEENYLKEGVYIGITWFIMNCLLDFCILIPKSDMNIVTYFEQIGLRYLIIPIYSISIGILLDAKFKYIL